MKKTPPASASGTASIIKRASVRSLYVRYRIKKISRTMAGKMIRSVCAVRT